MEALKKAQASQRPCNVWEGGPAAEEALDPPDLSRIRPEKTTQTSTGCYSTPGCGKAGERAGSTSKPPGDCGVQYYRAVVGGTT